MAIPKSEKLLKEENKDKVEHEPPILHDIITAGGPLKIKPIKCLNEYVAILKQRVKTNIAMPNDADMFEQEGIVVGIGPGLPDGCGGRVQTQLKLGDVVLLPMKTPIAGEFMPAHGTYADQKIVIVQERSILCVMSTKVEFELDDA